MSTVLVEDALATPVGTREREPTLQTVVAGAWAHLTARRVAGCPVCGERLEARLGPGRAGVTGRCTGCGSELR